jgi:hypothetical protein
MTTGFCRVIVNSFDIPTTEDDQQVNRKNTEQSKEGKVKLSLPPIPVVWFSARSSTANQS